MHAHLRPCGHTGNAPAPTHQQPVPSTSQTDGQTAQSRLASILRHLIGGHPPPFTQLDEHTLPALLERACDPRLTPEEREARFKAIVDQLPPRDNATGPLHAKYFEAILRTVVDPVERRRLFWIYHEQERHRFTMRTDNTPRLFAQVSKLQKPEHRSTEDTWIELAHVGSPGPTTNWPVWRALCRVLAGQMADVIQAFQQSRESPANQRRFNLLVLRVVLRLAAPAHGDTRTAIARQFELLSDLARAMATDHRPHCLRLLKNTCAEWIEAETTNRPQLPIPERVTGLLDALRILDERYGGPAAALQPLSSL